MKQLLCALAAAAAMACASDARAEKIAITGATVIDGNGGAPLQDAAVVIDGKRIVSVGRRVAIPDDARRIDAAGKFVIPGLMDANVHLLLDFWPYTLSRYEGRYDELVTEAAQVALRSGVTTVFDSWGPRADLIKARDAIAAGDHVGSRIYLAGNIVGFGGPYSKDFLGELARALFEPFVARVNARWQENVGPELQWMSPERVRQELRTYAGSGIDFIKLGLNGHKMGEMQYLAFSPRVQKAIVEEARRAGLTVQTHTTSDEGILRAVELGVDLMQHCNSTGAPGPSAPEVVRSIAQSRVACALLVQTDKALAWHRNGGPANPSLGLMETSDANARALIGAGAVILLSTDAGVFSADMRSSGYWKSSQPPEENLMLLGEGHFHWLLAVEQRGMKPMDALLAATRNIARAYRVDKHLGTLEAGKIADLLILDRNPLESAANYRSIAVVIKEGAIVDRDSLPTSKLLTAL